MHKEVIVPSWTRPWRLAAARNLTQKALVNCLLHYSSWTARIEGVDHNRQVTHRLLCLKGSLPADVFFCSFICVFYFHRSITQCLKQKKKKRKKLDATLICNFRCYIVVTSNRYCGTLKIVLFRERGEAKGILHIVVIVARFAFRRNTAITLCQLLLPKPAQTQGPEWALTYFLFPVNYMRHICNTTSLLVQRNYSRNNFLMLFLIFSFEFQLGC